MTGEYCCQDNKCCHTEEEDYRQEEEHRHEEEHSKEKEYSKETDEKNLEEENILDKIYSVDKNDVRNQNIKHIRQKSLNQEQKEIGTKIPNEFVFPEVPKLTTGKSSTLYGHGRHTCIFIFIQFFKLIFKRIYC